MIQYPHRSGILQQYAVSQLRGAHQHPFRYGDGPEYRPGWLDALMRAMGGGREADRMEKLWVDLIAHVANEANEKGQFDPLSPAWLAATGLHPLGSPNVATTFSSAGGLYIRSGVLYVQRWVEDYRCSDVIGYLSRF